MAQGRRILHGVGSSIVLLSGCAAPHERQLLQVDVTALHANQTVIIAPSVAAGSVVSTSSPVLPQRAIATPSVAYNSAELAGRSKPLRRQDWQPDKSPRGPVLVVVSLADQQGYIYRNGVLIGQSPVSTGKSGYETPTGEFQILQKKKKHQSNLYPDGDMPYMQRLTWDGIALHGGRVPDHPASHGCIRFPTRFARNLYKVTRMGGTVIVAEQHFASEQFYAGDS